VRKVMFRRLLRIFVATAAVFGLAGIGGDGTAAALEVPQLPTTPPSLPIDLSLTPPTTAAPSAPAPPHASAAPAVDGLSAPPALPGVLPSVPRPGAGGAGKTEPTDPCAQITGPAAEQGAPVAATCPITPSADGGFDIPICIDVALVATCEKTAAVTTTTAVSSGGGSGPGTGGSGSTATGSSGADAPTPGPTTAGEISTDVRGTGETLPLTGSAIVWLLTIGTALAATGGTLARVARRRFS
jgi:hypothetical protein